MADLQQGDGPLGPTTGETEAQYRDGTPETARPGDAVSQGPGAGADQRGSVALWFLVPVAAVTLFVAVSIVIAAQLAGSDGSSAAARAASAKVAPYRSRRQGSRIAANRD